MTEESFGKDLIQWYRKVGRQLPWRATQDPYAIWLSEIILQQTRVDQGLPYYMRFLERFENIRDLAEAEDDEVFRLWQGLGYYSRARNLLKTARIIAFEKNGVFPSTADALQQLPGIGPYTAAAIASFAFGQRIPAIDGNVLRVLSRLFALDFSIDEVAHRKHFVALAEELMDSVDPAEFNQAMMELGATVCKPKPACSNCPVQAYCIGFGEGDPEDFPVRTKKTKVLTQEMHYVILTNEQEQIAIRQRKEQGIWGQLYEFPVWDHAQLEELWGMWKTTHLLTHRKLEIMFAYGQGIIPAKKHPYQWVNREDLRHYAFPVPLLKALERWGLMNSTP